MSSRRRRCADMVRSKLRAGGGGCLNRRRSIAHPALIRALEPLEARLLLCAAHEDFHFDDPTEIPAPQVVAHEIADNPQGSRAAVSARDLAAAAPIGLPQLNSLPGAPTAVYLDFLGDANGLAA